MGSRAYELALELEWPYGDTPVIVLTHRSLIRTRENVRFYSGDLDELLKNQLRPKYQNIWMVGGAELTKQFIDKNLADEIIVSIMPIILGEGIPFFDHIQQEQRLHLKDVKAYRDGMVELQYEILKQN